MSFYSSKDGELHIDGQKAAKVRGWQLSSNVTTLQTTTLGDRDQTSVPGIRSTTASCDLFYYAADPNKTSTNSASTLLNKLIKASTNGQGAESESVLMRFIINDGTPTKKFIEGQCIVTSASMSMAVGEVLSASVALEFVGSPREMLL